MRADLSSVEPVLAEFWHKGMTGVKTGDQKNLVGECCEKTGLTQRQVKVLICFIEKSIVNERQMAY
jgi:hypothetical protein